MAKDEKDLSVEEEMLSHFLYIKNCFASMISSIDEISKEVRGRRVFPRLIFQVPCPMGLKTGMAETQIGT